MSVNWDAITAVAEVLGVFVVVVSLVYLAIQVRQNTLQLRIDNLQGTVRGTLDTNWYYHRDPAAFDAFRHGIAGFDRMKPKEKALFHSILVDLAFYLEMIRNLESSGLVNKSGREINERFLLAVLLTPGGKQWWQFARQAPPMPPAAMDYLQMLIDTQAEECPPITELQPWFGNDGD
ncbi:MAG: hypothetical protein ACR2QX_00690 [Woeseiaceae bacterium]